ncbi:ubiquinone biosynthesis protein COQ4 [Aquimarina brevivitae]|uniref:Ubiquinone biosynthesis protein COQ4 n=1 Tax=Aquimarina brevivitae TaxID=323412 RepID=A0A4Q7NXE6_9FLAO|nr:ubiquinone biosynthesis protein COQ4 [Aquimarina brevivitae]RZS91904.1 ubiquinone biosynthesis protein COQ4 [Aquimarina brevivitae]
MIRVFIIESLYELGKMPYQRLCKHKTPWDISIAQLLQYPKTSLGFHLGSFLLQHNFESQPQLEDHDVFHVLTNIGITVKEEIAMQYYLLGNGKRSLFMIGTLFIGTFFYPVQWKFFRQAYQKGKKALPFYHLPYKKLLNINITKLQSTFLIQSL